MISAARMVGLTWGFKAELRSIGLDPALHERMSGFDLFGFCNNEPVCPPGCSKPSERPITFWPKAFEEDFGYDAIV